MVPPQRVTASRSYGFDRTFFRRLYWLSRPYWVRKGCEGSWLTLAFLLSTVVAYSVCGAWITALTKDQTNALVNRDPATFWRLLTIVALLTGMRYVISTVQTVADNCQRAIRIRSCRTSLSGSASLISPLVAGASTGSRTGHECCRWVNSSASRSHGPS